MEIRNYAASSQNNSQATVPAKELSVNDFLQIMAAEMKNQSPFGGGGEGGGSKTDYITQMAQFTMLEQMGEISENLNVLSLMNQQQYTIGLIGKEVTVMGEEGEITGVVEKVKFQNGYAVIQVNEKSYNLGAIIDITNVEEPEAEPCCNSEAMDMILEVLGNESFGQGYPGYENIGEDYLKEDYTDDYSEEMAPIDEVNPEVSE